MYVTGASSSPQSEAIFGRSRGPTRAATASAISWRVNVFPSSASVIVSNTATASLTVRSLRASHSGDSQ